MRSHVCDTYEVNAYVCEFDFPGLFSFGSFVGMKTMGHHAARWLPLQFVPEKWIRPESDWVRYRLYSAGKHHKLTRGSSMENGVSWSMASVTVLVVVRNQTREVLRALQSAQDSIQQFSRSKGSIAAWGGIQIVDDGSGPEATEALKSWMKQAPVPVRLYTTRWQVGVTRARNLGLELIETPWVVMLDADNTLTVDAIRHYMAAAEGHPDAAAVVGLLVGTNRMKTMLETLGGGNVDLRSLLSEGPQRDLSGLFDLAALRKLGGFDEELLLEIWGLEDFDLWIRMGYAGMKVVSIPSVLGTVFRGAETHWAQKTVKTLDRAQQAFTIRFGPNFTAYQDESTA